MFKKLNLFFFLAGVILLLAVILVSPSFLELFTSDGKLESVKTIILIHIFQIYMIIAAILFISISFLPKRYTEKIFKTMLICLAFLGILFTFAGLLLTPLSLIDYFAPTNVLDQNLVSFLSNVQLYAINLSLLVFFISSIILIFLYFTKRARYILIVTVVFIVSFCAITYSLYISRQFPANIIFKPSEYSKVSQLILGNDILLSDYEPRSNLKVSRRSVYKSKFPIIDVHFHLASILMTEEDKKVLAPEALIRSMDSVGVKTLVNLDDAKDIDKMLDRYARKYPERFINFMPIKFSGIKTDEWLRSRVTQFENSIDLGARGLKVIKALGLKTRDTSGKLVPADDPRLDNLWHKVGELGVPVLWHAADPTAFFQCTDRHNERYTQLTRYPEWSFYGKDFPSKKEIFRQRESVLRKHPNTIIIGGHMGGSADDLEYIGYMLDTYPNFYVEISSTLVDLGRQPYTTRKFFIKYQDRILFGTDGGVLYNIKGWTIEKFYQAHFEFLETDNEFIDYPMRGAVIQGDWKIYGINLPDEVLEKIYYKNAEKIFEKSKGLKRNLTSHLAHAGSK